MRITAVLLTLTVWLLAGCAASPSRDADAAPAVEPASGRPAPARTVSGPRRLVLETAARQLGTPYRYGGTDPRGFDCSGLVRYSHGSAGVQVPRTAQAQWRAARKLPLSRIRPGDLLFFRLEGTKTSHVGIYAGNGQFIHAPSSGKRVSRASLENPYWRRHLIGAGSFF